jgi:hypothetical protein
MGLYALPWGMRQTDFVVVEPSSAAKVGRVK